MSSSADQTFGGKFDLERESLSNELSSDDVSKTFLLL